MEAMELFFLLTALASMCYVHGSTLDDGKALMSAKEKWQANLPSWTGQNPCIGWEGVICNEDLRVSSLNLSNRGIEGPLPDEIGHLDALTSLDLSNSKSSSGPWNNITGDLAALENLKNLLFLDMGFNYLNTEFPESVLKLTDLIVLRLDNAGLTGPFPTKLSRLTKLQHLFLGNNSLEGLLPPGIGNLVDLVELSLWSNELNSSIPLELSGLKKLTYLNMHGCDLWGGLPPEFGNLMYMQTLYLYDNRLSGTIPDIWENMRNLRSLRLEYNYLTKFFPYWTQSLPSLELLDLEHNLLYGSVEKVILKHAKHVNMKCNYFSGAPPTLLNTTLEDKGNCFALSNQEDKKRCSQDFYTCVDFSKQVPFGSCAACPPNQYLQNRKTCVCEPGLQDHKHSTTIGKVVFVIVTLSILMLLVPFLAQKWWKSRRNYFSSLHSNQEFEMFLYHNRLSGEDLM